MNLKEVHACMGPLLIFQSTKFVWMKQSLRRKSESNPVDIFCEERVNMIGLLFASYLYSRLEEFDNLYIHKDPPGSMPKLKKDVSDD